MDCRICFDKYNKFNRKPITLLPCCHTFCMNCLINLKKSSENLICPKCRKFIGLFKPNYAILEILAAKNIDPKLMHQISRNESVSMDAVEKFYSQNHDHSFEIEKVEPGEKWECNGIKMLGVCKSKKLNKEKSTCYKCTLCLDFRLCQLCLDEPEKLLNDFYYSENHEHRLNKCDSSSDESNWMCNGMVIFGQCKSNLNDYGLSKGMTRYKCAECEEFDFCQACLDMPKLTRSKVKEKNEIIDLTSIFNEN